MRITSFILIMLFPLAANAGLLGRTVTANYYFPDLFSPTGSNSATVISGLEWVDPTIYPGDGSLIFDFIDIGDDFIVFDFREDACCQWTGNNPFNGFEFIFESGALASLISFDFPPNPHSYATSMLSRVGDSLFVNWQGGDIEGVDSIRVNLEFATVPTPETLILIFSGICSLILFRRRMRC